MSAEKYRRLFTSFLSPDATDARKAQSIGNETVLMFLRTADSLLVSDSSHRFSCSALLNSADMMTIWLTPGRRRSRGRGRRTPAVSARHWGTANRTTTGRRSWRSGNGTGSTVSSDSRYGCVGATRSDSHGVFAADMLYVSRTVPPPGRRTHDGSAAGSAFSRDEGIRRSRRRRLILGHIDRASRRAFDTDWRLRRTLRRRRCATMSDRPREKMRRHRTDWWTTAPPLLAAGGCCCCCHRSSCQSRRP